MKDYKFKIQLPENFDVAAVVDIPRFVPLHDNFDHTKLIAEAVCRQQNNFIMVNVKSDELNLYLKNKDLIGHGVAGLILEQKDNLITKFKLESVSITPKLK
jgi:hypothetical protein